MVGKGSQRGRGSLRPWYSPPPGHPWYPGCMDTSISPVPKELASQVIPAAPQPSPSSTTPLRAPPWIIRYLAALQAGEDEDAAIQRSKCSRASLTAYFTSHADLSHARDNILAGEVVIDLTASRLQAAGKLPAMIEDAYADSTSEEAYPRDRQAARRWIGDVAGATGQPQAPGVVDIRALILQVVRAPQEPALAPAPKVVDVPPSPPREEEKKPG